MKPFDEIRITFGQNRAGRCGSGTDGFNNFIDAYIDGVFKKGIIERRPAADNKGYLLIRKIIQQGFNEDAIKHDFARIISKIDDVFCALQAAVKIFKHKEAFIEILSVFNMLKKRLIQDLFKRIG